MLKQIHTQMFLKEKKKRGLGQARPSFVQAQSLNGQACKKKKISWA